MIELLVTVLIIGLLLGISTHFYVKALDESRESRAINEIRSIEKAIANFEATNGHLPDSLDEVGWGTARDPWGNSYQYKRLDGSKDGARKDRFLVPLNSDYDLYSMGPDGDSKAPLTAKASRDDIVRAADGAYIGIASEF